MHDLNPMKSLHTPCLIAQRLPRLLCAGLFALTLSASADDHGRGHGSRHHDNPHFNGHPPGHAYGWDHGRGNYNNNHAYSQNYRGRNYYNNSNYDHTNHRTLLNMLLNR